MTDADVNVAAEDEMLARELLVILPDAYVTRFGRDGLIFPMRKRMRSGGGESSAIALCGGDDGCRRERGSRR